MDWTTYYTYVGEGAIVFLFIGILHEISKLDDDSVLLSTEAGYRMLVRLAIILVFCLIPAVIIAFEWLFTHLTFVCGVAAITALIYFKNYHNEG